MNRLLAWLGGIGGAVGIACCFTPLLPVVLTAIGAGGLIGVLYRDTVLLPFAALSLIVMGVGLWRMRRT